jgi:hypothetical protein
MLTVSLVVPDSFRVAVTVPFIVVGTFDIPKATEKPLRVPALAKVTAMLLVEDSDRDVAFTPARFEASARQPVVVDRLGMENCCR